MSLQERCVWDGGLIVACAPWDVMAAVQRHQLTAEHRAARRRAENREATAAYRARMRAVVGAARLARELLLENPGLAA